MLTATPANARLVTLVMIVKLRSTNASRLLVFAVSMLFVSSKLFLKKMRAL